MRLFESGEIRTSSTKIKNLRHLSFYLIQRKSYGTSNEWIGTRYACIFKLTRMILKLDKDIQGASIPGTGIIW